MNRKRTPDKHKVHSTYTLTKYTQTVKCAYTNDHVLQLVVSSSPSLLYQTRKAKASFSNENTIHWRFF